MKGELTLSRWGNSLSIRIPKKLLDSFKLDNNDKFSYEVKDDKIVLTPEKKKAH